MLSHNTKQPAISIARCHFTERPNGQTCNTIDRKLSSLKNFHQLPKWRKFNVYKFYVGSCVQFSCVHFSCISCVQFLAPNIVMKIEHANNIHAKIKQHENFPIYGSCMCIMSKCWYKSKVQCHSGVQKLVLFEGKETLASHVLSRYINIKIIQQLPRW